MAIGVFALGTIVVNLFSAVGERPGNAVQIGDSPIGTIDFALALSGVLNAPLHRGGTARLLNNGDEFLPASFRSCTALRRLLRMSSWRRTFW
jgi:hypothetical protein